MKKRLLTVVVFACATIAMAQGGSHPELIQNAKSIETAAAMQEWVNYYYLHPRPDLAPSAFKTMISNGLLAREEMRPGVIAFFAAVLRANPKLGPQLVAEVRNPESRMALAHATWLSNSESATEVLDALGKGGTEDEKRVIKEMLYRKPPDLMTRPIRTEWDLDALWASFFATGDLKYVKLIVSTAGWAANSDPLIRSIGEQSQRTLAKNAVDHPRVLQACEQELAQATGAQKDTLAAVIQQARQGNGTR